MRCHWIGTTGQLRPEVRFEQAGGRTAYEEAAQSLRAI